MLSSVLLGCVEGFEMVLSFVEVSVCCALCPLGLTYQWFGMVWDTGNDVKLNKLLFPIYDHLLYPIL